jgi:hypothetical protein
MARIPAVCYSCGAFFPSPIDVAPGSTNVTLGWNVVTRRCPRCGGSGRVLDGIFDFTENALRFISGPEQTVSDLERLAAILRAARERKASLEEIRQEVQAQVPQHRSIVDLLVPKSAADLYAFIAVLLMILQLVQGQLSKGAEPKMEVNEVMNQIMMVNPQGPPAPPSQAIQPPKPMATAKKVGRNDPCTCGSGKKYKKCCLNKP